MPLLSDCFTQKTTRKMADEPPADAGSRRRRRLESAKVPEDAELPPSEPLQPPEEVAEPAEPVGRRRRRQLQQPPDSAREVPAAADEADAAAGEAAEAADEANASPLAADSAAAPIPTTTSTRVPPVAPSTPASQERSGGRRNRLQRSAAAVAPAAMGDMLAEEERKLLSAPVRIDQDDLYPADMEPHFLVHPPAPELGEAGERYVELPPTARSGRAFRRVRAAETVGPDGNASTSGAAAGTVATADSVDAETAHLAAPSGAVQAGALIVGLLVHVAQGALAGVSLMQAAATPWPGDDGSLIRPMAYAKAALPLNRTLFLLAAASFLASCDLHAAAPRAGTAILILFHAIVVLTCVLQLPTDVALHVGRAARDSALTTALETSLFNTTLEVPYRPDLLPEMAMEEGSGFFSTALSAEQFGFWQALISLRAFFASCAWLLACLLQSHMAFGVPPVASEAQHGYSEW